MPTPNPGTFLGHPSLGDPLHILLDKRLSISSKQLAYRFLTDGESHEQIITIAQLAHRAKQLAATLIKYGASGKVVLLIRPPGIGFIEGLFACWYAGAIAVPAYPPRGKRHRARLHAIMDDCDAAFAIAGPDEEPLPSLIMIKATANDISQVPFPFVDATATCLIQYTSGSTAAPKGVMISHQNLRAHFQSLALYQKLEIRSALSWLPPYHDMGLVLKILYAFEAEIPLTFFSPEAFIQRPARWLQAINRYRAEFSGAPNFAFEMCLRLIRDEEIQGIDLSCWKAVPCGAERIRADTLERFAKRFAAYGFRREAFLPGYGLAEATLSVTVCPPGVPFKTSVLGTSEMLVSSGPPLPGITLSIVNPADGSLCAERSIGEIRIKGPVVSNGYWNSPAETLKVFGNDGELRTADLGYLDGGELFVTGRIKDLIIIDGTNHAPEDIESAILTQVPQVTAVAAFANEKLDRESIYILAEIGSVSKEQHLIICRNIRKAVWEELAVSIRSVGLVRNGLLPRTTSGKIRRAACRTASEEKQIKTLFSDKISPSEITEESDDTRLTKILNAVTEVTGRQGVRPDDDVIRFGMSSMETTRFAAMMESYFGVNLGVGKLFEAGTFRDISALISTSDKTTTPLPEIQLGSGIATNVLSHSQERMWYLYQLDPSSAAYHVFGSLEMTGPLDFDAISSAISTVITRHEILRSRHGIENGRPKVWIDQDRTFKINVIEEYHDDMIRELLVHFAREPFQLDSESPVRICLVKAGRHRNILAISVHHIVADGWSLRILAREIAACYEAIVAHKSAPIFPEKPAYQDYALAHRRWIDSGAVNSQIDYWKSLLAGHSGILPLATDFPRSNQSSSAGNSIEITLNSRTCDRVAALARDRRCTPFMVHLTVFLLFLSRHGAGDDPVVAIPVANRNHAVAGDLIGTLVNTLPFRLLLSSTENFLILLDLVREATFAMQANQDAPFEKIIDAVKPERSQDHSPLAQVMFDHQEIPISDTWTDGLHCKPYIAHRGAAQFDLSLLLTVLHDHQQLAIEYRTDLFTNETASSMLQRYLMMLESVCANPDERIDSIDSLTQSDRSWLATVSQGPVRPDFIGKTAPAMITARCALHPRRIAFTAAGHETDYGTIARLSDNLAAALISNGVKPGDRVAVILDRLPSLPIALLAIWKTGAAYIPLDPTNPSERLKLIIEDQLPLQILISPTLLKNLPHGTDAIILEDSMFEQSTDVPTYQNQPEDPAYVIYTSGSTGKPKGVVVSHAALANFLLSMQESPGFDETDRLLAVTTISFDIAALEIFLPLITGGRFDLLSADDSRDGSRLLEILHETKATVMQATPATWRMMIDAGWKGTAALKILCGGEALDLQLATHLRTLGGQLWNLYGPTETTVWSTLWQVSEHPETIRIGHPIANTGIHILADDGSVLPPGVTGQLWISGSGLANGYWKRPNLTAEKFVNGRYHTGDLARWNRDGSLECLGRTDGQIKIRGFRVELEEIEAAISQHPHVAQTKVTLRGQLNGGEKLVAWITVSQNAKPPSTHEIRKFISRHLPAYMLPSDIAVIDAFPLNSNGKVDISRLADPKMSPQLDRPVTATEKQLAVIWSNLLDRDSIHLDDDWFHIGGHSLLALRLFSRIHNDFLLNLPISTILGYPTLRSLALKIDEQKKSSDSLKS